MPPEPTRRNGSAAHGAALLSALIALAGTAVAACARAQDAAFADGPGFDARLLRAPSDRFAFATTEGSGALAQGEYDVLLAVDYAAAVAPLGSDPSGIKRAPEADLPLIDHAVSATVGAQLGLLPHGRAGLSLGAALPVLVLEGPARAIEGSFDAQHALLRSQGLGAPSVVVKWSPLSARRSGLGLALLAQADFSLGDGTLRSAPDLALWPRLVLDALGGLGALSLNVGYRAVTGEGPRLTAADFERGVRYGDQLTFALGARARVWGPLQAGLAFDAAQLVGAWGRKRVLASELLAALRVEIPFASVLQLGGGIGLTEGWNEADGRVFASVALQGGDDDPDGDGVRGDLDACPGRAEDFDLDADGDGCPEPDGDADAIPDASDACPADRGSTGGAGCPLRAIGDQDGDGVDDYRDPCPAIAGGASGCPAPQLNHEPGHEVHAP